MTAYLSAVLLALLLSATWVVGRRSRRPFLRSTDTSNVVALNRARIERLRENPVPSQTVADANADGVADGDAGGGTAGAEPPLASSTAAATAAETAPGSAAGSGASAASPAVAPAAPATIDAAPPAWLQTADGPPLPAPEAPAGPVATVAGASSDAAGSSDPIASPSQSAASPPAEAAVVPVVASASASAAAAAVVSVAAPVAAATAEPAAAAMPAARPTGQRLRQLQAQLSGTRGQRLEAIAEADQMRSRVVLPLLRRALRDPDPAVVAAAVAALERFRGRTASSPLPDPASRPWRGRAAARR